jgi:putative membrane protein
MMVKKSLKKNNSSFFFYLLVFFKGLFMGFCDVVPGVSGGTIALITGIYARFVLSLKKITSFPLAFCSFISHRSKKRLLQDIQDLDLLFFIVVITGMLTALLVGAHLISFALEYFFIATMMFFIGLIIASVHHIYRKVATHDFSSWLVASLFFFLGLSFVFLQPESLSSYSWWYIIIVGFFASAAMILPGISGSFILLVFGVYELFINALKSPFANLSLLSLFAIGIFSGFALVSSLVSFYFKKNPSKTYIALIGLVLGAVFVPLSDVLSYPVIWNLSAILFALLFFLIGFFLVLFVDYFSRKYS